MSLLEHNFSEHGRIICPNCDFDDSLLTRALRLECLPTKLDGSL